MSRVYVAGIAHAPWPITCAEQVQSSVLIPHDPDPVSSVGDSRIQINRAQVPPIRAPYPENVMYNWPVILFLRYR